MARRFTLDVWGARIVALADQLLPAEFVNHDPFPGTKGNREGEKQSLAIHGAALGEAEAKVDDQIAAGDMVVTRWTFRAAHKGEIFGIALTGKKVETTGINVCRIEQG